MRTAEAVLDVIRQRGTKGLPLEQVYRQLFNRNLYLLAYGNLYSNQGAMTRGVNADTVDGMSLAKIDNLIADLRSERFKWQPARRIFIPKANGKKRPLGIPVWTDKLLQEVMRLILEAYFEPQFSDRSHGFRPNRGCHTALRNVTSYWTGTKWFIEGDIKGCFDHIDHSVLLGILGERINDNRFLRLVKNLLAAGYMEDWKYNSTLSGTPQGGIISPLLSNIYLDRLDKFVEQVLIPKFTRGAKRADNPAYWRAGHKAAYHRKAGNHSRALNARKLMRTLPSRDPTDSEYRRLRYVRYADDFLLGFIGPKSEAAKIKDELERFLLEELRLELSAEKTLITHATSQAARFLGYDVINQHADDQLTLGRRRVNGRIGLRVPHDVIRKYIHRYMGGDKPRCRTQMLLDDDFSIVGKYGSELRGIVNYYVLAYNVHHLGRLKRVMELSLSRTLAAKHKTTARKMRRKYRAIAETKDGKYVCLRVIVPRGDGKKPLMAQFGGFAMKRQQNAILKDSEPVFIQRPHTELVKRLLADECELCGSTDSVEVHHIRALRDLNQKGRNPKPNWVVQMAKRRRKTLVVCFDCHRGIHNGSPVRANDGVRKAVAR
jgi:group II intron reverse transcriptase/maturase